MSSPVKLIECPRDAMQGIHEFVPTALKAAYINALLKVGFDTIDFGSFVSPKAIPQLRDTREVLDMLDVSVNTELLAIVANLRGVDDALLHPQISYLGFPFSISETFQQRNTNSSIENALQTVAEMLNKCDKAGKQAVIYLSMGFGNPYGDAWNPDIVNHWAERLVKEGVQFLSLADTTGISTPAGIGALLTPLTREFPEITIGLHLHSLKQDSLAKINAAFDAGCTRMDSAMMGFGGCPMAADDLTGNIATEDVLAVLKARGVNPEIDYDALQDAQAIAQRIFL